MTWTNGGGGEIGMLVKFAAWGGRIRAAFGYGGTPGNGVGRSEATTLTFAEDIMRRRATAGSQDDSPRKSVTTMPFPAKSGSIANLFPLRDAGGGKSKGIYLAGSAMWYAGHYRGFGPTMRKVNYGKFPPAWMQLDWFQRNRPAQPTGTLLGGEAAR